MKPNNGNQRRCRFCPKVGTKKEIRGHVYYHFIEQILDDNPHLRTPPFNCPKCTSKKWRDRSALVRHFALTHKVIDKYCDIKDVYGRPLTKHKKVKKVKENEPCAKDGLLENRHASR